MKRLLSLFLAVMVLELGWAAAYVVVKRPAIRAMDEKYQQVTKQHDLPAVIELFGEPHQIVTDPTGVFWDDRIIKDREVSAEYRYTVQTLYLSITWAFGVDQNGRVVSKHRYD